jgi:hypothetical protein
MEKAKVKHRSKKNETIITRFGELKLDHEGCVEVDKDIATKMCDITLYGGTFSHYHAPKPVKAEVKQPEVKVEPIKQEVKVEAPKVMEEVAPVKVEQPIKIEQPIKVVSNKGRPKKS